MLIGEEMVDTSVLEIATSGYALLAMTRFGAAGSNHSTAR